MSDYRCYLEINKENYRYNLKNLQAFLPEKTSIIGVVKANYYGHGAKELAEILVEEGVNDFAVATINEAIKLRNDGIKGSILLLSYVEENCWLLAHQYDLIIPIASMQCAQQMSKFAKEHNIVLKVEVKVDTGMHRIGVNCHLSNEQIKEIYDNPNLKVNGTFTHLCCADSFNEKDQALTYKQKELFDNFISNVESLGLSTGRTHVCASSGIMNYPEFVYDFVRPGFILLGYQVGDTNQPIERKPVLSWYSKIEMVKEVEDGQGVSYGHIYHTKGLKKIATVSVGYGDGYPRRLSNKGYVIVNGQKANIVGRICMDQLMIDVSDIDCKAEDRVTLIGEGITANQLADMADTIVDEIVCGINERVTRYFI